MNSLTNVNTSSLCISVISDTLAGWMAFSFEAKLASGYVSLMCACMDSKVADLLPFAG
uniref:Uncharacterized protein n=1 Tax=Triticum urartu TaxID=4572 RepID=A0A8R7VAE6_TRIUA